MTEELLKNIVDAVQADLLEAVGLEEAVLGVDFDSMRLIYSVGKCIDIYVSQGMSREDAREYFDYNVRGAYVGEQTPIWCDDDF